jgi:hypothetical protein
MQEAAKFAAAFLLRMSTGASASTGSEKFPDFACVLAALYGERLG